MKVVTGDTMQAIDRCAIDRFGVPGLELMERAGRGCVDEILQTFGDMPEPSAVVVAGKGNNGGDGFVIARLLRRAGWAVRTLVVGRPEDIGGDAKVNLLRLNNDEISFLAGESALSLLREAISTSSLIIDAIFGTGLKSGLHSPASGLVEAINESGKPVLSVDIPSGVDAGTGRVLGGAVRADVTVTFAVPKLGHVLYPGAGFCGRLRVVDIGIPSAAVDEADGFEFIDRDTAGRLIRRRLPTDYKGRFGHMLLVAGATGKSGAAALAANSAVRAGAGLVTLAVPEAIHGILEVKTTEAMTLPLSGSGGYFEPSAGAEVISACAGKDVVAIGPGIGRADATVSFVQSLVTDISLPMVIDADGLNAVSEDRSLLLARRAETVVLTPHPGEMARLASMTVAEIEADRIGVARAYAKANSVYLILKGARTIVASPLGEVAINGSGNPGMASGGMGDVLTGVIAALLGQGYAPFVACKLGVFIHGHAADLVADEKGEIGITATDVQERLPLAFRDLIMAEPCTSFHMLPITCPVRTRSHSC